MKINYFDVVLPNGETLFVRAHNATAARKVAREILGVGKLPKGTKIHFAICEAV